MKFQRDWGTLTQRLENDINSQGGQNTDPRLYKPKVAKDGTFSALIRFLPAPGNEVPLVKTFHHRFKDRGGEYNEMCPTTIGKPCPICDANRPIYEANNKEMIEKVAQPRTRNATGYTNILIISDPQVPQNNGKVFLWRFGKQILTKINTACFPDDSLVKTGVKPINVFDYYTGVNFRIIIQRTANKNGRAYPSYQSSQFDTTPAPIGASPNHPQGDEEIMGIIEKQLLSLLEFSDVKQYKPYEQLLQIFNTVQGIGMAPMSAPAPAPAPMPTQQVSTPAPAAMPAPTQPVQPTAQVPVQAPPATSFAPSPNIAPTQSAPAVDPNLDFGAVEGQSEDDFWGNIKKNKQG